MEQDVYQLLQEADRVTREAALDKHQKMLDLLMRKSKELRDAMRNAGGAQYMEMENMQALVLEARAGIAAKMNAQTQQGELDYAAKKRRELQ